MCWASRVMAVGLTLALAAGGCPCEHSYYRDWSRANAAAIQDLRDLAARKDWKIVACGPHGVFVLDLAQAQCEPVYTTKNRIWLASPVRHGRVALIESMSRGAGLKREFTKHLLVIVDIARRQEVGRVSIENMPGYPSRPQAILLRDKDVIFPAGGRLDRYDLVSKRREVVLAERPYFDVTSVEEIGEYLCVTRSRRWEESELLLLDMRNAYAQKARYEGIWNVASAGGSAFVEREGKICRSDPVGGVGESVTDGVLLGPLGDKGFMYSDAGDPGQKGSLFVYYPETGESKKLSEFEHIVVSSHGTYPFASPQADYVFVCRLEPVSYRGIPEWYWEAYEVATGRLVGAFYNPYLGKWYLSFLLGWVD